MQQDLYIWQETVVLIFYFPPQIILGIGMIEEQRTEKDQNYIFQLDILIQINTFLVLCQVPYC